jgi:hypothetical protein
MATSCGFESHRPHHWPPNEARTGNRVIAELQQPALDGSPTRKAPAALRRSAAFHTGFVGAAFETAVYGHAWHASGRGVHTRITKES